MGLVEMPEPPLTLPRAVRYDNKILRFALEGRTLTLHCHTGRVVRQDAGDPVSSRGCVETLCTIDSLTGLRLRLGKKEFQVSWII